MKTTQHVKRARRHNRIRARVIGSVSVPRLSVFRSGQHMYAQLIDDAAGKTLCAVSDATMNVATEKKEARKIQHAFAVGKALALKAKEKGMTRAVFDRSGYAYHGRVQAVAEGAREGGLQF